MSGTVLAMHMATGFSVTCRNKGHWDIYVDGKRRYCIRGKQGHTVIRNSHDDMVMPIFSSDVSAMAYLSDIMMHGAE